MYVCGDEVLAAIGDLLLKLRMYVNYHTLAERFAGSIEGLLANIYYSGFISKLTVEHVAGVMDLSLRIGWRNLFYLSDQTVLPLVECLTSKRHPNVRSLFVPPAGLTPAESTGFDRKVASMISQLSFLTFPGGESGRKIVEQLESRLATGNRAASDHFSYQRDSNMVMHQATENLVHFFLALSGETRAEVLSHMARLAYLEARNEQSDIIQQTLILYELISWHCHSNMERISAVPPLPIDSGKLWLINE